MTDVEEEREACAKICEGRAIYYRATGGQAKQAAEADGIARAIRDRTLYPDTVKKRSRHAIR